MLPTTLTVLQKPKITSWSPRAAWKIFPCIFYVMDNFPSLGLQWLFLQESQIQISLRTWTVSSAFTLEIPMFSLWGQEVTLPHFSDSCLCVHSFNSIFFPFFFPTSSDLSSYFRAFNTCMRVWALSAHPWQRAVTLLASCVVPLNETHETPESPRGSFLLS